MIGIGCTQYLYGTTAEVVKSTPDLLPCCSAATVDEPPIDPSLLSRLRKRIGEENCELILQVSVQAVLVSGRSRPTDLLELERVTIETTAQEKAVTYPSLGLFNMSRERLVRHVGKHGVRLRQNYNRLAPCLEYGLVDIFTPVRRNGYGVRSSGHLPITASWS